VQEKHKNELQQVVEQKNKEIEELTSQLESFKLEAISLSERLRKHQKEDPDLISPDEDPPLPIGDITMKKKVIEL
jgi:predicted nuclease with TOPRIM domain